MDPKICNVKTLHRKLMLKSGDFDNFSPTFLSGLICEMTNLLSVLSTNNRKMSA